MTEEGESDFIQSYDYSQDSSTSSGSSFGNDEKKMEGGEDAGVLKSIKLLKYSVLFLSIMLAVSLVVIIFLIILSTYLLYFRKNDNTIPVKNMEERYLYPFVSTSNGEIVLEGTVMMPNPMEDDIQSVISEDQKSTLIWYEMDEHKKMFEVTSEGSCCADGAHGGDLTGCKDRAKDIWKFPAFDEKHARLIFQSDKIKKGEHVTQCGHEEMISKIEEEGQFHCHSRCEVSSLSYFFAKNPGLLESTLEEGVENWKKTDQKTPIPDEDDASGAIKTQILDKFAHICMMSGIAADTKRTMGDNEASNHFRTAADRYCGNFAGVENNGKQIFWLCRSDPYYTECRPGPDCWDPMFHSKYLPQDAGDAETEGNTVLPPEFIRPLSDDMKEEY